METKTVTLELTNEQAEHILWALARGASEAKEEGYPLIADELKAFRETVAQQTVDIRGRTLSLEEVREMGTDLLK